MLKYTKLLLVSLMFAFSLPAFAESSGSDDLRDQVASTERAFAKTMADRDFDAFSSFLSDEAVFFSGPDALRGKEAVAGVWKGYYESPEAPFSWEPETVEVLNSGTLALSTGPVRNPAGETVGTFTSIWRQESPGVWKIIFDKGNAACDPEGK